MSLAGGNDFLAHNRGSGTLTDAQFRALYNSNATNDYGDGRHGVADLDGTLTVPWASLAGSTYTMVQDCLATRLRVRNGITLIARGFHVRANVEIYVELTGKIHWDGAAAAGAVAGAAYGAGGTLNANLAGGAGGAATVNGTAGTGNTLAELPNNNVFVGGAGGAGSGGTTGGVGGAQTSVAVTRGHVVSNEDVYFSTTISGDQGGTGGGGGGGGPAAAGGGGGASGGVGSIAAPSIVNLNPDGITADGGAGAAGVGAGAGGGGGGGGGVIRYRGLLTGYLPHCYAGASGAAGDATGFPGKGGFSGRVRYMGPTSVASYRVDLTAAECAAAITAGGVLDVSGSALADGGSGINTGAAISSQGGGGFWLWRATTAGGVVSGLRYDATNNRLDLVVRGVLELSTAALAPAPAAPTMQNFRTGDTLHYRFWFDPAGGARSMGIRFAVGGGMGNDTTGVGSGAALAALTAATAIGTSATVWAPTVTYLSGSTAANVAARVLVLGHSMSAPRVLRRSLATHLGRLGVVGPIVSLAQVNDTAAGQMTDYQGSASFGAAAVTDVVIGPLMANNILGGQNAATATAEMQALIDNIAANNASARIWLVDEFPIHGGLTEAQQAIWVTIRQNYAGTGPNPITGVSAGRKITSHVATVGDANFVLRMRDDSTDNLHPDDIAVGIEAQALVTAGLA
jgi:hypothetical protein